MSRILYIGDHPQGVIVPDDTHIEVVFTYNYYAPSNGKGTARVTWQDEEHNNHSVSVFGIFPNKSSMHSNGMPQLSWYDYDESSIPTMAYEDKDDDLPTKFQEFKMKVEG